MARKSIWSKIIAFVMSMSLLGSLCACSDQTWSVKAGDVSMPMGTYILFMYQSYLEAKTELGLNDYSSGKSQNRVAITNKKIGDKKVSDWIYEKTLEKCKVYLFVHTKFNEMGLSFSEEELNNIQKEVDQYWDQGGSTWEEQKVSKDSYYKIVGEFPKMQEAVFKAMYGKEGVQAVSDESLENFYMENYINCGVLKKSYTKESSTEDTADDDSATTEKKLSDEEIAKIKETLDGYAQSINDGKLTADELKKQLESKNDTDKFSMNVMKKDGMYYSDEIKNAFNELEIGKAKTLENEESYYLLVRGSIDESVKKIKEDDATRENILYEMKNDEFESLAKDIKVQINYRGINAFPPSYFDPQYQ